MSRMNNLTVSIEARHTLQKNSLLAFCYSYIHTYLLKLCHHSFGKYPQDKPLKNVNTERKHLIRLFLIKPNAPT